MTVLKQMNKDKIIIYFIMRENHTLIKYNELISKTIQTVHNDYRLRNNIIAID